MIHRLATPPAGAFVPPAANRPSRSVARTLRTRFLLLLTAASTPAVRGADNNVVSVPPVLVSTTANAPRWETIAQLAAAAAQDDPLACFQFAQLLESGDPAQKLAADPARALALYERAAAQAHGESLFRLGKINHDGLLDQPVDHRRAFALYQRAARAGIAEGTYNVGAMLVSGRGVKRDYVEGLAWLLLAAEQGTDPGSIDQVRERLRNRPRTIAAAETRLPALKAELAARNGQDDGATPATPAPGVTIPRTAPPRPEMPPLTPAPITPSFTPPSPAINVPKISIPPVAPAPPPAEEP